jgi:hypothetical protein
MLKLAEIENEKLAEIKLIQLAQDAMLPEFEAAADLLRLELAPFVKYGRVPFVDVSAKSELIHIRVTVQKTSAKSVSFIWLNESYRVTPSGGLFYDDSYKEQPIACDADRIAAHFLSLNGVKIRQRFEKLLPH